MKKLIRSGDLVVGSFALFFCFFIGIYSVSAHPGNTDSSGCHTCRTNCPSWGLSYGEYHCHNSKPSSSSYTSYSSTPSIPSCPSFSSYSYLSKTCECYSGYTADKSGTGCISMTKWCTDKYGWNSTYDLLNKGCECSYGYIFGKGLLGDTECISGDTYCRNLYGYNSNYNILSEKCECRSGYLFGKGILSKIQCISGDTYCSDLYGSNSSYDSFSKICECDYGYSLKSGKCVKDSTSYYNFEASNNLPLTTAKCGLNSHITLTDKCSCDTGYVWKDAADEKNFDCIKKTCSSGYVLKNNDCITNTKDCENYFGLNVYGISDGTDKSSCYCTAGFEWNTGKTSCVKKQEIIIADPAVTTATSSSNFLEDEKNKIVKVDKVLSNKLSGKILLQVENKGQAWYVNPSDKKRYYMADGDQAYNIMKSLGIGLTNSDLQRMKTDKKFAKSNSGKIFLQVEDKGQAYYIDFNGEAHYLKDGEAAYDVLRELGLGVTDKDLNKIDIK